MTDHVLPRLRSTDRSGRRTETFRGLALSSLVALVVALSALIFSPSASAADMTCEPGWCHWGYNYMGADVNTYLTGGWNYWYDQYVEKQSGGTIAHGFNTASGCYEYLSGGDDFYGHPGDTGSGCGGYLQPFALWPQGGGATSYLYMDDYT